MMSSERLEHEFSHLFRWGEFNHAASMLETIPSLENNPCILNNAICAPNVPLSLIRTIISKKCPITHRTIESIPNMYILMMILEEYSPIDALNHDNCYALISLARKKLLNYDVLKRMMTMGVNVKNNMSHWSDEFMICYTGTPHPIEFYKFLIDELNLYHHHHHKCRTSTFNLYKWCDDIEYYKLFLRDGKCTNEDEIKCAIAHKRSDEVIIFLIHHTNSLPTISHHIITDVSPLVLRALLSAGASPPELSVDLPPKLFLEILPYRKPYQPNVKLHDLVSINRRKIVKHICKLDRFNLDVRNEHLFTPIYYCHTVDMARILLDNGASLNVKDKDGVTPLHYMVKKERLDMVELLVKYGADLEARDNMGYTPLDYAKLWNTERYIADFLTKTIKKKKQQQQEQQEQQ